MLKILYLAITKALMESRFLSGIIGFQHRYFPLPIPLFDRVFRNRTLARLLAFYGHHVFHADYANRSSNEDYWLGRRSLYWHLFRLHDVFALDTYPAKALELLDLLTETFDVLMVNGGVLMYCDRKTVDEFFARLPETGCKYVVVMGEGGPREVVRPDNTTMYALKDRLLAAYPENLFVEELSPAGQYAAFAMLDPV